MFSRPLSKPLAQGLWCSTTPGGRVDLEEKQQIDNTQILLEMGRFLKGLAETCE